MASKKGILFTIVILGGITGASFLFWIIPQSNEISFVTTDFEDQLDGIKEIHQTIKDSLEKEFTRLLNNEITPEEYIKSAEISSSQVKSQIIRIVESKVPEDWYESYENYLDSLRQFNEYIRETIVVAKMLEEGKSSEKISTAIIRVNEIKKGADDLASSSDKARP